MMLDLEDKRFGKLIATNQTRRCNGRTERLCYCDCGKSIWISTSNLTLGRYKSCGCWQYKIDIGLAARNIVFDYYRRNAYERQLEWALSSEQFDHLVSSLCFYCKRLPRNIMKAKHNNGDFIYNGIDRLNNHLGYTVENTVACCKICNRAKRDMSLEDFMDWINGLKSCR